MAAATLSAGVLVAPDTEPRQEMITVPASGSAIPDDLPDDLLPVTDYPPPVDAIHVSDSGEYETPGGTVTTPHETIADGVDAAPPGGTVVVHEGVYRESLGDLTKSVTLQAAPGEKPWVVGTRKLSAGSFTKSGNSWRMSGWTFRPSCRDPEPPEYEDPPQGEVRKPEAVYVDGVSQRQVWSSLVVTPGTFYVNRLFNTLHLGTNPNGAVVEATVHEHFATVRASDTRIRGLGFARFASSVDPKCKTGMVMVEGDADDTVIEDSAFVQASADALVVRSPDAVVRGNTFDSNGNHGIGAYRAYGIEVSENVVTNNNTEGFTLGGNNGSAAGMKLTHLGWNTTHGVNSRARIIDNIVTDNDGRGIWCDLNCGSTLIARNIVARNNEGIFYEVSHAGDLVSNILVGNRGAGIRVAGSHDVRVINNTALDNQISWFFQTDDRARTGHSICFDAPPGEPPEVANRCVTEVLMANNLSQHTEALGGAATCEDHAQPVAVYTCNPQKDAGPSQEMFTTMDHQAYVRTPTLSGTRLMRWALAGTDAQWFDDLVAFQQAVQLETNGLELTRSTSVLADPDAGDFTVTDPALTSSGASLPGDLAAELGLSASPMPRGAFAWPTP